MCYKFSLVDCKLLKATFRHLRLHRKYNTTGGFFDIVNIWNIVQQIVFQTCMNSQKLSTVIRANGNHAEAEMQYVICIS